MENPRTKERPKKEATLRELCKDLILFCFGGQES